MGTSVRNFGFCNEYSSAPIGVGYCVSNSIERASTKPKDGFLLSASVLTDYSLDSRWLCLYPCFAGGVVLLAESTAKKVCARLALVLLLLNIPWIVLFWRGANVSSILSSERPAQVESFKEQDQNYVKQRYFKHKAGQINLEDTLKELRDAATRTNPLLLILALPGLLALEPRVRSLFVLTSVWLLFMGSALVPLKPQLELDRMLVVLAFVSALPAALALSRIFEKAVESREGVAKQLLPSIAGGFLLCGVVPVLSILDNRTLDRFSFADTEVFALARAIEKNAGSGRVLFSGFVLHDLSHGHLAPLAVLSNRPMLASSHMHDKWRYAQIFPKAFLDRGDSGIQDYLNLFNVTLVIAHELKWIEYFSKRPQEFKKLEKVGKFWLFSRKNYEGDYFLHGSGDISEQTSSSVTFKLETEDAVVKFRYHPWLISSDCTLRGETVANGITFVRFSKCQNHSPVVLKSASFPGRLREVLN